MGITAASGMEYLEDAFIEKQFSRKEESDHEVLQHTGRSRPHGRSGGHQDGPEPGRRPADPLRDPRRSTEAFLESLVNVRYQERAAKVMGLYLTDYT